jgi:acid phosphatase type 7
VGWSEITKFRTPPAAGSDELSFVIFGDMGKAPLDPSVEHYIQVAKKYENVCLHVELLKIGSFNVNCTFTYEILSLNKDWKKTIWQNCNINSMHLQPGSITVTNAVAKEMRTRKVDSIFHIGDISYATGFLVEWDFFLHLIAPLASQVPYMTAIGNHER